MITPDIVTDYRIIGEYQRGPVRTQYRWTVYHKPNSYVYVAYTRGDRKSPCDIGWGRDRSKAKVFYTQRDALEYLNKIVQEAAA